jgi:hypothetical protein
VAALVCGDHMQAGSKTKADAADERIHEMDTGEIDVRVVTKKRADVGL